MYTLNRAADLLTNNRERKRKLKNITTPQKNYKKSVPINRKYNNMKDTLVNSNIVSWCCLGCTG